MNMLASRRRALLATVLLPTAARGLVTAATATKLVFEPPSPNQVARKYVFCGTKDSLLSTGAQGLLPLGLNFLRWKYLVELAEDQGTGKDGVSTNWMFTAADGKPSTIVAAVLPDACSRHASPVRPHAVTNLLRGSKSARVVAVLDDASHAGGTACAVGRAFPLFSAKSRARKAAAAAKGGGDADVNEPPTVTVGFTTRDGLPSELPYDAFAAAAEGVRRAGWLVDLPPDRLGTNAFVGEAQQAASRLAAQGKDVSVEVITGEELRDKGYNLLWSVGKAAVEPPALVVMSHVPGDAPAEDPQGQHVCLVGKGIVYDTGGLSLKSKDGMPGMKSDCGGAAATLAAFEAAVAIGVPKGKALHLVLCLAENAIGPGAMRNDDVIEGFSGLTCEINNSDAEGRLVLADGVAHATAVPARLPGLGEEGQPALIVDMATLTGAQMIATGQRHAGVLCNGDAIEEAVVRAGRLTGDTVHPLPFCPEFHMPEFKSEVADMKNSVKNRANAQSSCAGSFIHAHLHPTFDGPWVHVDLAGPSYIDERGTGFGVGLALALVGVDGFRAAE